ncbi:MAG: TerC/Alx family metal homeostasis membrane protein [Candidatus Saccharimonas sp.]|nr:TerC/Alx family metal homeostasis membrane protein [Planctomycetaceae bacterium]
MIWAAFLLLVLLVLAFDLGLFTHGDKKALTARAALLRTAVYFCLAMLFTVFVYFAYESHWFQLGVYAPPSVDDATHDGHAAAHTASLLPKNGRDAAIMFFMGYILEQSLSVDNIFVIALVLGYFQVPAAYQHRVLLWGILGALVMRGVMIGIGVELIHRFHWMTYVFGLFLLATAIKMLFAGDEEIDFETSLMVRLARRVFRLHPSFVQDRFFTKVDGKLAMTPLFLALVIVETTDLVFAVDSIPAVIGLTNDSFLVFTSNVFAILGLRSLYFALADLLGRFRYLKFSLVAILALVGIKMLIHDFLPTDRTSEITLISLAVIAVALAIGIGVSLAIPEPAEKTDEGEPA